MPFTLCVCLCVSVCVHPPTLLLIPLVSSVCANEAEERHGRRLRRGSAEEAAGGGGFVQPGPVPLHLHPGPGSQDPWPPPSAQKLRRTHATKTVRNPNSPFHIDSKLLPSNTRKLLRIPTSCQAAASLLFTDPLQRRSPVV